MKNLFKTGWIVLLVGAVMTAVGVAKNGARSVEFDGIKPVEVKYDRKITRKYDIREARNLVMSLNRKADGSNGNYSSVVNIEVRQGDAFSAKYSGSKDLAPVIRNEGDTLRVYAGKKSGNHRRVVFDMNGLRSSTDWTSRLVITVPRDYKFSSIENDGMNGDLTLSGLKTENLKLHMGDVSDVTLNNIEADKVDVDVADDLKVNSSKLSYGMIKVDEGDLSLSDSEVNSIGFELNDGDFTNSNTVMEKSSVKADDGDISASNATIRGRCQFISQDGDIDVTNAQADGYVSTTSSGDNLLHTKKGEATTLEENPNAENILVLMNSDGDNSVK